MLVLLYKTLSDIIDGYLACGELPDGVNTEGKDEGDGIEATFKRNQACWHMSGCRTLLHACTLERLKRRATMLPDNIVLELDPEIQSPTNKFPCLARSAAIPIATKICFFCEEEGENLHRVMTFNSDAKVHQCAEIVKDTSLLAKLAGSDMIALESKYHSNCLTNLYRSKNYDSKCSL